MKQIEQYQLLPASTFYSNVVILVASRQYCKRWITEWHLTRIVWPGLVLFAKLLAKTFYFVCIKVWVKMFDSVFVINKHEKSLKTKRNLHINIHKITWSSNIVHVTKNYKLYLTGTVTIYKINPNHFSRIK